MFSFIYIFKESSIQLIKMLENSKENQLQASTKQLQNKLF